MRYFWGLWPVVPAGDRHVRLARREALRDRDERLDPGPDVGPRDGSREADGDERHEDRPGDRFGRLGCRQEQDGSGSRHHRPEPPEVPHVPLRLRPRPVSTTRTGRTTPDPRKSRQTHPEPLGTGARPPSGRLGPLAAARPAVAILARSPGPSQRPGQGGPAIARGGRIGRPVRRPSDEQPSSRRAGGRTTREICIQVPAQAGTFFVGPRGQSESLRAGAR